MPSVAVAQSDYSGPSTSGGNDTYHSSDHSKEINQRNEENRRETEPRIVPNSSGRESREEAQHEYKEDNTWQNDRPKPEVPSEEPAP
jgi:hypothetical protein